MRIREYIKTSVKDSAAQIKLNNIKDFIKSNLPDGYNLTGASVSTTNGLSIYVDVKRFCGTLVQFRFSDHENGLGYNGFDHGDDYVYFGFGLNPKYAIGEMQRYFSEALRITTPMASSLRTIEVLDHQGRPIISKRIAKKSGNTVYEVRTMEGSHFVTSYKII